MRRVFIPLLLLSLLPAAASAQELSAAERGSALSRARAIADCLSQQNAEMQRLLRLVGDAEQQRDQARDARVRRDAEVAIEALIARAADVQRAARTCVGGTALPSPGTTTVERGPPPDAAADSVAGSGGTVAVVEENATLAQNIRVVRAEQVDGQGRVDPAAVRSAMRTIGARLGRCYEDYLGRGTLAAQQLNLVFTVRRSGAPRTVDVERSGFEDARFERCVRTAGRRLRISATPRGGEATFSYTLRFGRER